ncbi:hypothetical protein [Ruminococcus flavefaciens]|uniref:hypothetical protein n=1 Tax=Ruminococcus flavefaciens TaxID=1265 RepID=UPI0013DBA2EE|nr:hypothetical protein [Ruminococcus flavefaciens]
MARRNICVTTKNLESCIIKIIITIANVVIGVWCGLSDKPKLIAAFYVAILLQAIDTTYEYLSFLSENKRNVIRWFRNTIALLALVQGFAIISSLYCISNSVNNGLISIVLCILISLPALLLVYELVYHMIKV